MNAAVSMEVDEIRRRLSEITSQLKDPDSPHRDELLDEEYRLQARLGKLGDMAADEDSGVAEATAGAQSDLTRSPKLQEDQDS